jgi:hypothetical protein
MAEYVLVENGVITEYHSSLPASWSNISGLNLLKDDVPSLVSLGWYPVTKVDVTYDPETARTNGYSYEIFDQWVTETPIVESIPESEIRTFEQKKAEFLNQLRSMRTNRLKDSDWTQLLDSPLSDVDKVRWQTYRQALRDLPSVHLTDSVVDISQVNWPVF